MPGQNFNYGGMITGEDPAAITDSKVAFVAPDTSIGAAFKALSITGGHSHHGGVVPGTANGKKGSFGIGE